MNTNTMSIEEEAIVAMEVLACHEVLEELIKRLELTNGLDFCAPARVKYAVMLLEGFSPGTEAKPPEEGSMFSVVCLDGPEVDKDGNEIVDPPFDGIKAEKLNVHERNLHRFDMVQRGADYGRVDTIGRTNGFSRKWSRAVKKDADCMYRQVRKLLQSEGRW